MQTLDIRDRLSHYKAFARHAQEVADRAALAANIAEKRYARANQLVRDIEDQLAREK